MHEHKRYIPLSAAADSVEDMPNGTDPHDIWLMNELLFRLTERSRLPSYIKAAKSALEYVRDPLGAGEDEIGAAAIALHDSLLNHRALLMEQANGLLAKRVGLFVVRTSDQIDVATAVSLQSNSVAPMVGKRVITMLLNDDWAVDTTFMDETERYFIAARIG